MEKKLAEKSGSRTAGNAVFAIISQMITTLTPLITTPFVTRMLGASNLGIFVHTLTMVQYFQMFANLGIVNYGTRTLAEDGGDVLKISKHFWEIFGMQVINTSVFFLAYCIYLLILPAGSRMIALIQILWIAGAFVDLNWFFYGIEEIRLTAIRDLLIKVLTIAGIFLFVRSDNHPLAIYTLIMAAGNFIGLLIVLPALKRYIVWVKPSYRGMLSHLKPNLVLFVPILAMSVFHSMDKTMLGYMTSYDELGFYYNADKIINVPLQITNVLGTVFLPKASYLLAAQDHKGLRDFLKISFEITILLSCALALGIAGCAKDFVPVFFGEGFESCTVLIYLFVPVLIIKSISTFFRMEYLVPMHQEKLYITATFAGAAVNLVFNSLLIPHFGARGAVIGTLMAELAVMIVQFKGVDNNIPKQSMAAALTSYFLIAVMMLAFMKVIALIPLSALLKVVVEIGGGALIYIGICFLYWKYISRSSVIPQILLNILSRKGI